MKPEERGFLLLTGYLGNPSRRPLTQFQLKTLAQRVQGMESPTDNRELEVNDLKALGYGEEMAAHIVSLLEEEALLDHYLSGAKDCVPITRFTEGYPVLLRQRLGQYSPGCLWARGDLTLLEKPAVSLVGSRDLQEPNRAFAQAVGYMAARNALVLISGNARGADRAAQEACLAAGGQVISIVADELLSHPVQENTLYLSEDGYNEPFSAQRALSRNRCIHAMGQVTFVAQASLGKGGTWDGTVKNLRNGWSNVICFRDGSQASRELDQLGAYLLDLDALKDFNWIPEPNLFDAAF